MNDAGELQGYRALATKVLAVSIVMPDVSTWTAYIDAVPGFYRHKEWQEVVEHGAKLPESVAAAIFPRIAAQYKYRR